MGGLLDVAVECLRPLVETTTWDFCILWNFGDDPSSYIQWRGCCCSGGNDGVGNVKRENLVPQCRDIYSDHSVRTKACEKLSKFPSFMPLYSGIHGEVILSNQPRWFLEEAGTQVFVPVEGGLVELFSAKQVPINHQTVEFVLARYCCLGRETMAAQPEYKLFPDELLMKASTHNQQLILREQIPSLVCDTGYSHSLEGSFTSSNIPKDQHLLTLGSGPVSCHTSPEKSSATYPRSSAFGADNDQKPKPWKRKDKLPFHSKNLITERSRRERIKHGILTLRSIVPNISKMDKSATLTDACDYIQELQKAHRKYADELKSLTEECDEYRAEQEAPKLKAAGDSSTDDKEQVKVDVQVSQIGASDFLVKIIYRKRCSDFFRLMKAMESLGLQVIDANVTTLNGLVLNNLTVEAFCKHINLKSLKDSLREHICQEAKRRSESRINN